MLEIVLGEHLVRLDEMILAAPFSAQRQALVGEVVVRARAQCGLQERWTPSGTKYVTQRRPEGESFLGPPGETMYGQLARQRNLVFANLC